jgi:type II secretory pathway pseudopilin PulG
VVEFKQPDQNGDDSNNRTVLITCLVLGVVGFLGLLVVGGILAALLMPALGKARLEARFVADRANLHFIGMAIDAYRTAYDGQYPPTLAHLLEEGYLDSAEVLVSPADESPRTVNGVRTSYVYIGTPLPENVPNDLPIAYTRPGVFDSRQNVLYPDLSVRKHGGTQAAIAAQIRDEAGDPVAESLNGSLTEERKEELREFLDGIPDTPSIQLAPHGSSEEAAGQPARHPVGR